MFGIKKQSRFNYWACSKVSNWIRGNTKPGALSWGEWDTWHKLAKKKHPLRYWMAEEGLTILQDIVYLPSDIIYTIRIYIKNRFIDKIHYIRTGLKPGEYYDLDYRILNGLFYELVEFVESEQAHLMKVYEKERNYKFINGRCVRAGLDYLNWACNLRLDENYGLTKDDKDYGKLTDQAKTAYKILKLYNWWKNRSNRLDPHDVFSKEKDGKYYYREIQKLEEAYEQEDTKMLIKLIKIRGSLWT